MPKSNRKTQLPKKLRSESPPPELEDAVAPELTEGEASTGTPTPGTYVVSEADTASGTSSATEDNFIPPLPVVPAPKGKTPTTSSSSPPPEPAPRLVDTANLLFAHSPRPDITFDQARGRAAHLRRRLDELHQETLQGLQADHRPGTSRPAARSNSPPRPGATFDATLSEGQLEQIKRYLQGQQLLSKDRSDEGASASARCNPDPSQDDLLTIPLLTSYRIAFRNHFEGVTCKILRLNSAKYMILYIATYGKQCPLNCGKGPCDTKTYAQHLAKEHPSAILLQCPVAGCGGTSYSVHQFLYHFLRTHGANQNPLAAFVSNRLRNCPYGSCPSELGHYIRKGSETSGATLAAHLAKDHLQSLAVCNCGPESFDTLKLLHHLWDSYPEISAIYRRVEQFLQDVRNITRTRGSLLTQSIPVSTALDIRRVDFNCKGLPNEIEFIDLPRRETRVQAQTL